MYTEPSVQIKAPDEILKGEFSNVTQIFHTEEEIYLDFLSVYQHSGTMVSRIITTPKHFKRLVSTMKENLDKYEKTYGEIKILKK